MSSFGEKGMMKRSDFAQKLLDDLRVRKEQLSVSDKYAYSNRGFKGFQETRANTTTFQDFNYGGNKSLTYGDDASNQMILPYGKGRSMENIDLSKALAFALENAGKATRGDPSGSASIIRFLHEVGKRSLGYGTGERRSILQQQQQCSSSQQLPMVHVHIKEISKGAQKLNQIIKACSNGLSFRKGKYSIQCGEEIMEGAAELEQSLRLLVDIQQASSDYTTKNQRTNRIKLLEENDEDEEEDFLNGNYQKIKEVAKADIEMRLLALKYPEDRNKKHKRQTSSCEDTEQRSLKPQKGRIPNVVAKLMGLGEFPEAEKETKNNNDASIKSSESFARRRVMQVNENVVEVKSQRNTTSLDLVIHKETRTGNETNYKAKSPQKDIWGKERDKEDSVSGKRNKVSDKKDGEMKKKNVFRRSSSSSSTENKHKVVARSKQKPSHNKLSFEKKIVLHQSEEEKRKEKLQKVNGSMTNHSTKHLSSVDIQTKVPFTEKAKGLRKSFSHVEVLQKKKEGETHKVEIFEKKNQETSNENGKFCEVTKRPESQKPSSKEADQLFRSYKDSNQMKTEAEASINSSEVSGGEVKSSKINVVEPKREIKDDSILLITAERVPCQATPESKHHEIMLTDVMEQEAPIPKSVGDSNRLTKTEYKGTKGEVEADLPLLEKQQEHPKTETTEELSENEIILKKIFVKSQLFLDTAEALFKLNLPLNVLYNTGGSNYDQEDKNLILDCGYELMKRKGRFQELSVHPFVKSLISSSKVNTLDHLVRQLSKEFEKLRVYGRNSHTGSLVEDYLPKVLERDVHHKDPNLNSMWDMGWNDLMFAFIEKDDVVRDIEREVFSGILEDITRDLICI